MKAMKIHPAAEMFPMMDDAAFEALAANIKAHGQREPIIVHDGSILDGRNRYRACLHVGTQPEFMDWSGSGDPIAFVVSMNLHRRHLNESQRQMIARRIANMQRGDNQHPGEDLQISRTSVPQAAKLLNVGERGVREAGVILRSGTAAEISAVERGEAAVSTTAKAIRERESKAARKPKAPSAPNAGKPKVYAPEGVQLSDHIRAGIALEAEGKSPEEAATQIKIGIGNYRILRDIVLLSENSNLSRIHQSLVQNTLADLDKSRQMAAVPEEIETLRLRVWGGKGAREGREQSRLEQFARTIGIIAEVCAAALTVDIPYLSEDTERESIARLKECQRAITKLCNNILEVRK